MRKKICFVVAIPGTAISFLKDHIRALKNDYDIYLAVNIKDENDIKGLELTGWQNVGIHREISILHDICAVIELYLYFKKMKFDAVHSVTPKAGFITALAAYAAGIKVRTHIFTGQVWATSHGFKRWMLKTIDKMTASLDNHILVDGKSQREYIIGQGIVSEKKALVFADGSICGVNSKRFVKDAKFRDSERKEIGIGEDKLVFIFLGRLKHDKGIEELLAAFNLLIEKYTNVFLLLVGRDEEHYSQHFSEYSNIKEGENFYYYGRTSTPEKVLNAGDVFVLPTYREGFGSSVLEAASIGLPSICSDAYGVQDAYVEGETGFKCRVGDYVSLLKCMEKFVVKPSLIRSMGEKARKRALTKFNGKILTECWVNYYHKLLGK